MMTKEQEILVRHQNRLKFRDGLIKLIIEFVDSEDRDLNDIIAELEAGKMKVSAWVMKLAADEIAKEKGKEKH